MKRKKLLVTVSVIALVAAGTGLYVAPLMADPAGDKDCGERSARGRRARAGVVSTPEPRPQLGAARRHGQRCELPQPHRRRRRGRGPARERTSRAALALCAGAGPDGLRRPA